MYRELYLGNSIIKKVLLERWWGWELGEEWDIFRCYVENLDISFIDLYFLYLFV